MQEDPHPTGEGPSAEGSERTSILKSGSEERATTDPLRNNDKTRGDTMTAAEKAAKTPLTATVPQQQETAEKAGMTPLTATEPQQQEEAPTDAGIAKTKRPPTEAEIVAEANRRRQEVAAEESADTSADEGAWPLGSGWHGIGEPIKIPDRRGGLRPFWDGGGLCSPGK